MRDANRLREAVPRLGRVEVEEHEVGPVGLVYARVPRVHIDAIHLHRPDERGRLVDEHEVDESRPALARPRAELTRRHPRRLSLRRLLGEVGLRVDSVGIALERERPVAEVRDDCRADRGVVLGEVALRHPVGRKEDALRVRESHKAATDLDLVAHLSRVHLSSCLSGSRYRPASSGRTRAKRSERSSGSSNASALVVEYSVSSSSGSTVTSSSARSRWSGSNGTGPKASCQGGPRRGGVRWYGSPPHPPP